MTDIEDRPPRVSDIPKVDRGTGNQQRKKIGCQFFLPFSKIQLLKTNVKL